MHKHKKIVNTRSGVFREYSRNNITLEYTSYFVVIQLKKKSIVNYTFNII